MCFIWATSGTTRSPLQAAAGTTCQFCKAENTVSTFEESRVTYLYGCCPTQPKVLKGFACQTCHKEWYQGGVQEVTYTQEQQPGGVTVVVKGASVAK